MKVLDLFSGIGGFSLGLEAAGMETIAFCEREPFCQAVLKKHWPKLPCHDDIITLDGSKYAGQIDVIAGGFPCQDISVAGKGKGLAGERSGLWSEYWRLIKEIRPRYAIIENVSALRSRGLEEVLRSLNEIGYDAEWHCITASSVGAPHRRDRVWIVAYARGAGRDAGNIRQQRDNGEPIKSRRSAIASEPSETSSLMAHANAARCLRQGQAQSEERGSDLVAFGRSSEMADTHEPRLQGRISRILQERASERSAWQSSTSGMADTNSEPPQWIAEPRMQCDPWIVEPSVGRVVDGLPGRVDRIKALGNAIVPQIAQVIGQAIMEYENDRT